MKYSLCVRYGSLVVALALMWGSPDVRAQPEELPLGSELPGLNQSLERIDGTSVSLSSLTGKQGTVFIFWSNQCPWVQKYEGRVNKLVSQFQSQGIRFIYVNSNDASAFPQESLKASRQRAQDQGYDATYVRDSGSALAQALGASRTPHVYVFDTANTLVYVGAIDDSPGDPGNVKKTYLRDALSALVQSSEIDVAKTKAFGCTIKYQQ